MKLIMLSAFFLGQSIGLLYAQKIPLDQRAVAGWPKINYPRLSPDGNFFAYNLIVPDRGTSLIFQSFNTSWKKEFSGVKSDADLFTADNKHIIFKNQGDSLCILELGTEKVNYISGIDNYQIPPGGDGSKLVYKTKGPRKNLVVFNFITGAEKYFFDIDEYLFDKGGETLLLNQNSKLNNGFQHRLLIIRMKEDSVKTLDINGRASDFVFSENGGEFVFLVKESLESRELTTLRYYRLGTDSARTIVEPSTPGMGGFNLKEESPFFSRHGDKLFFYITSPKTLYDNKSTTPGSSLSIRTFYDDILKSDLSEQRSFLSMFNFEPGHDSIVRLGKYGDNVNAIDGQFNWIVAQSNITGKREDYKFRVSARPDLYLVSCEDGSRRLLRKRILCEELSFSLGGKFVIWFDREKKQWYSYNISSTVIKELTNGIGVPVYEEDDHPDLPRPEGLAGWSENDGAVFLYDRYDIWRVDLDGVIPPVNITNGYGRRNKIRLRYLDFNKDQGSLIKIGDTIFLSAFNTVTKQDGFFSLILKNRILTKLTLSSNYYGTQRPDFNGTSGLWSILKTKDGKNYITAKMSATEFPNFYLTSNFRDFRQLTDFSPQKKYNWYTTELVRWKLPNGRNAEGILYKPEDFDPKKQYPVIFYYYEKNSFALNVFINPELANGPMNIPWFVSNGYLVFVPDIYYETGYPGRSAFNSVVSAAMYLSKKPWVARGRMGLQGHSYGGFETNYIISHSSLFAAAAPASGASNIVSFFGESEFGTWFFERRQGRMGATLWERPDLYRENSAVFRADRVTAAVLIMHGIDDVVVPYSQALQWYEDLHRAGKKVWLLSYNAGHVLSKTADKMDYSIRLAQFFDYYLKRIPPKRWMGEIDIRWSYLLFAG